MAEVVGIADEAVGVGAGIAAAVKEGDSREITINSSVRGTGGAEVRSVTLVADTVGSNAANNTSPIGLQVVSGGAYTAHIGTVTGETVGLGAEEAGSLGAADIVEQVLRDAGTAEISDIATSAIVDVTRSALSDATGEQSRLVAGLADTVSRTDGTIDQIADVAGTTYICVDGVIAAVLAVVETITEGAVINIAQLAHSVAERIPSHAG